MSYEAIEFEVEDQIETREALRLKREKGNGRAGERAKNKMEAVGPGVEVGGVRPGVETDRGADPSGEAAARQSWRPKPPSSRTMIASVT